MTKPVIATHLKTSNVYVQRQIIRDNIARIKNHRSSSEFIKSPYLYRREVLKVLDSQISILTFIDKKIKSFEQQQLNL